MGSIYNAQVASTLAMVLVQVVFTGVNILCKLAANDGMSLKILIAYRLLFAAAVLIPLALVFGRRSRAKMTWVVVFQAFLCGFFGASLQQNLYVESLALTSATFASAMSNLIPAIAFIMAISFRLERLAFGTLAGKAKVIGTLICMGGAMLFTLYKGPEINIWSNQVDLLHEGKHPSGHVASPQGESFKRLLGSLLAVGACLSYSLWLTIQAKMSVRYPCHYSTTALMCVMGSIQAFVFAFFMERDWNQWKLGWNIRLLTVAYTGIIASGLMVALIAWCVRMRGPLFASVFGPLMLVMVAIAGSLILDEKLHLGSIIGAVFIVCGLYVVLWGKSQEMKTTTQKMPSKSLTESESTDVLVPSSSTEYNDNNDGSEMKIRVASNSLPTIL